MSCCFDCCIRFLLFNLNFYLFVVNSVSSISRRSLCRFLLFLIRFSVVFTLLQVYISQKHVYWWNECWKLHLKWMIETVIIVTRHSRQYCNHFMHPHLNPMKFKRRIFLYLLCRSIKKRKNIRQPKKLTLHVTWEIFLPRGIFILFHGVKQKEKNKSESPLLLHLVISLPRSLFKFVAYEIKWAKSERKVDEKKRKIIRCWLHWRYLFSFSNDN